ncbi:MAG: hypothetical protein ACREKG_05355, partial [Candidatus Rokuibacteriota bacterium]
MAPGEDSSTLSMVRPATAAAPRRAAAETFPPVYRAARGLAGLLLRGLFDLRVEGMERLPAAGS